MGRKENHQEIFFGARIKQLRRAKGLTQKAFADSLGIVQGYLSGIESGQKIPSNTLLIALCHIHGIREEWLFDGTGEPFGDQNPPVPANGNPAARTPLLKTIPQDFPNSIKESEIADHIHLPDTPEGSYAIIAVGDFMAPTVHDGDLVVFKPGNNLTNRSLTLLSNKWGEVILRRARINGREIFFSAENTSYAPFHPDANTRIFGTVIDVWRKVKLF